MERIIDPIDKAILKRELNSDRFLRTTRKGGNEIYCVNIHNSPNVLKEIGRLREVTFRASGGGTGQALDLDDFDTSENCYDQLIVWSPEDEEIIGGYRFILCKKAIRDINNIELSTAHYFSFSEKFITDYLPNTIELGRSWVQPNFQPTVNPRKGLFALDNIWDGLGDVYKRLVWRPSSRGAKVRILSILVYLVFQFIRFIQGMFLFFWIAGQMLIFGVDKTDKKYSDLLKRMRNENRKLQGKFYVD